MVNTAGLGHYQSKRNFDITSEPQDGGEANAQALSFVIQKHWASQLHYDFRLELDGTMKSWAVPKGPSFDPKDKRMAVHVEDHPMSYSSFEGTIPPKQYGAGKVIIWDKGIWRPIGDAAAGYANGNLKFELFGHKLHGKWALVKMHTAKGKQEAWLLIKEKDDAARPASEFSVVDEQADSVKELPMPAAPLATIKSDESEAKPSVASSTDVLVPTDRPPANAKPAALPATLKPELATLVDTAPTDGDEWLFEIKFDGYRMLTRVENGVVRLLTRNGNDWSSKLTALCAEIKQMDFPDGWYDGEIVVLNAEGKPDFGALQLAFDENSTAQVAYFLFDVPYCAGHDLRDVPLIARREILARVVQRHPSAVVQLSDIFAHAPDELVAAACQMGLEGVIGKRRHSRYVCRRSADWIKLKCAQRQEFVIGGYTDPQGKRSGLGSLLLGVHGGDGGDSSDHGGLRYVGNVGSGFTEKTLRELKQKLDEIRSDRIPFISTANLSEPLPTAHFVKPILVAEVSFAEWTRAGHIRHAIFHGLRSDKPASSIVRERAAHLSDTTTSSADKPTAKKSRKAVKQTSAANVKDSLPTSLKITHPERVMDAASGTTKLQLIRYYGLVAPLIMPHLAHRPVALVRAPAGVGGALFFQKHAENRRIPGIAQIDLALMSSHPGILVVENAKGLLHAAQWNTVELHTMNATTARFAHPDRMIFDLDPGDGVAWQSIQEAAVLVRAFLQELGLQSFLKTSGGKGLHVVVPIKPRFGWDAVKDFSEAIVVHLKQTIPERFVAKSGPRNRVGKIFVDYLRNGLGATTVSAWSARARPGMGISVPLTWDELPTIKASDQWTVRNVHERLDVGNAPWLAYEQSAGDLAAAMRALGYQPSAD